MLHFILWNLKYTSFSFFNVLPLVTCANRQYFFNAPVWYNNSIKHIQNRDFRLILWSMRAIQVVVVVVVIYLSTYHGWVRDSFKRERASCHNFHNASTCFQYEVDEKVTIIPFYLNSTPFTILTVKNNFEASELNIKLFYDYDSKQFICTS